MNEAQHTPKGAEVQSLEGLIETWCAGLGSSGASTARNASYAGTNARWDLEAILHISSSSCTISSAQLPATCSTWGCWQSAGHDGSALQPPGGEAVLLAMCMEVDTYVAGSRTQTCHLHGKQCICCSTSHLDILTAGSRIIDKADASMM